MIPAVGQGALAIETRAGDVELGDRLHAIFADLPSEFAVRAERAFLRRLRGGCQAPVGAHATYADGQLRLQAAIAALDGARVVRGAIAVAVPATDPAAGEAAAEALAERLMAEGGAELLAAAEGGATGNGLAPLAGRLMLLPRTQDRPSRIAPALRAAGAEVIEAAGDADAAQALAGRTPDVLLFPSSGSVLALETFLVRLRAAERRPFVATMGAASSAAARRAGFPPDVTATEAGIAEFVQAVTSFLIADGSEVNGSPPA